MKLSIEDYIEGIKKQDITIVSKAITLVESKKEEHRKLAKVLLGRLSTVVGKAKRIGISGTPGVGKSTFIESFGMHLIENGFKVAVLAIDPTSYKSGGSILGDKTRMNKLSTHKNGFVRPSPSGKSLGGVASKTRESMLICDAAGFDFVIIETVGVGQSEVTISKVSDYFMLLMQPAGGDDLQGIKRGILELADVVVINKADGQLLISAKTAKTEYESALHIMRSHEDNPPKVLLASAIEKSGLKEILEDINNFYERAANNNELESRRDIQLSQWVDHLVYEQFEDVISSDEFKNQSALLIKEVKNNKLSAIEASEQLFSKVMDKE